jgi:hypothetical protein
VEAVVRPLREDHVLAVRAAGHGSLPTVSRRTHASAAVNGVNVIVLTFFRRKIDKMAVLTPGTGIYLSFFCIGKIAENSDHTIVPWPNF